MTTTVLVTGGAGFIGSNLIRLLLKQRPDWSIINLDKLTYAGHTSTMADFIDDDRHQWIRGDISCPTTVEDILARHSVDGIINLAAESHVDRSIDGPGVFVQTNVTGVQVLLEAAQRHGVSRFVQVSTDEVYGELGPTGRFTEETPLAPSSPYSASKASGDLLALAWHRTFGLDVRITRCSNNHGPYQFPEKLIPVVVARALAGQPIPVYGDGSNVRDWIDVGDHCRGILATYERGRAGRVYNFGGDGERSNLQLVELILSHLNCAPSLVEFVQDRPGHDWRYAIDCSRARAELSWNPHPDVEATLRKTVDWYVDNRWWWEPFVAPPRR